jgi:cell shape-determining protein MreD
MSYFFNGCVGLTLVVLQTAVMPYLPLLDSFYNLLIPFIVFLGLYCTVREGLPFVLILGFLTDNLSGSPVGLYLTAYIWLFIGVKGITALLQVGNRLFIITLIVAAGVLIENLIFLGTLTILSSDQKIAGDAAKIVTIQVLWAIWTGPVFLLILRNLRNRLDAVFKAIYASKRETS